MGNLHKRLILRIIYKKVWIYLYYCSRRPYDERCVYLVLFGFIWIGGNSHWKCERQIYIVNNK